MKRILYISLSATASLFLFSCSKDAIDANNKSSLETKNVIEVTASIPERGLTATKVNFEEAPNANNKMRLTKITWKVGDKITIEGKTFSISEQADISNDGKTATFSGNQEPEPNAQGKYTVEYNDIPSSLNSQTQASDGSTDHLGYSITVVTDDYKNVSFASGTDKSSILQLRAQLPESLKNSVRKVVFKASQDIFNGNNQLTVTLGNGNEGCVTNDGILDVYATLPYGAPVTLSVAMDLLVQFQTGDADYLKYTAYRSISPGEEPFISSGKVTYLGLNCSNIESYANASNTDIGSASNPYLVGDQHQMQKINDEMAAGETKYFKLVDDIDMTLVNWTSLNPDPFTKAVNFDGNNKKISHLVSSLFNDLNGTVVNLTIEDAIISGGSNITGILANTIKTAASTVTNVDINGTTTTPSYTSSVTASQYTGGLIGQIDASNTSITNCDVINTNVSGTLAGGVIGFANALVTMSGCNYSGGTVSASNRYCGGMLASTGNFNSVITDCHVENATIRSSSDRAGGFAGQIQTKVQVKGCAVGTSAQRVTFNSTRTSATANVGGFVGVNYGKITKNGDIRSKAFVTVTSSNTTTSNSMNIGGFVGYNTGTVEYSDADVSMASLQGQYIGGFCGILLQSGKIENSTETGTVSGNNYTGGFVGVIDSATTSITGCSSAGSVTGASSIGGFAGGCTANNKSGSFIGNVSSASVTSSGTNFGGFIGNCVGTFTSNYATGDVTSTSGNSGGGFAGAVWEGSTGSVFSKNYATGNVSGKANLGGLIGYIGGNLTMTNCYATGNVGTSSMLDQKYGGLVGYTTDNSSFSNSITISNCYSTGNVEPSFAGGGLIGRIGLATVSVSNCAAWGATVKAHNSGLANWSSAAVVGVTFPTCTLTGNYRKPGMAVTAYWGTESGYTTQLSASFDHADVSSTHPLTDSTGTEMGDTATAKGQAHYPQYPYHGHYTSETSLSTLASTTLGWSSDVWDFSGPLPLLK